MPNADLPLYIVRGGEQAEPPPYDIRRVTLYTFLLDADSKALQSLLDRDLNAVSGSAANYSSLFGKLLLVFSVQGELTPVNKIGWLDEIDVGFWIPAFATGPDRFVFYQPYLFVDQGYAIATGREVFGFHKMLGRFQIPTLAQPSDVFTIDTVVSRGDGHQAVWERIVQVDRVSSGSTTKSSWTSFAHWTAHLVESGLVKMGNVALPLFSAEIGMVFLKQFRDVADPSRACYQAVTEAKARPTTVRGGGVLDGSFVLNLRSFPNFPLSGDLGLKEGLNPIQASFWMDFDFLMEPGRVVWQAP